MTTRIYERISSRGQNLDAQHGDLDTFARAEEAKGHKVKWYQDTFTGKTLQRPGFKKLLASLRPGDSVIVWRLDRLGRTARGLLNLLDDLQRQRVNFVSIRENIDVSTPSGRLMFTLLGGFAQYETEVRQERIEAAKETRRKAGIREKKTGRPLGKRSKLTPKKVRLIKSLHQAGTSVSEIKTLVGLGSRNSVYEALKI